MPISGDILLLFTGYYVYHKQVDLVAAIVAVELGSLVGASFLYLVGRKGGHTVIVKYGKYISLNPTRVQRMEGWFQRHSGLAIIVGRLIPGLRPVTSFVAGTFEISYQPFFLYTAVGTLVWVTPFLLIGYFAGKEFDLIIEILYQISQVGRPLLFVMVAVTALALAAYYLIHVPKTKGRRHLNSGLEASMEIDRGSGNMNASKDGDKIAEETAVKEVDGQR